MKRVALLISGGGSNMQALIASMTGDHPGRAVLVFSTLIGEISATVLLYSAKWKTISIAIYELVLGDQLAQASAIGTITTVMTLLLVLFASRLAGKNMAELFR